MKKAVISDGGKQYLVTEGQVLDVEKISEVGKTVEFKPLLIIDDAKINVGTPEIGGAKVSAAVVEAVKGDKVTAIRYKAKKRVKKIHGHRQQRFRIEITKIQ